MQPSELESLAFETLQIVKRNDSRIKISKTLRQFLKEESIIARTQNCKTYFKSHLNALAANLNVTIIFCCTVKMLNLYIIHPLPGFEPRSLNGTEYEADGIPMGHHASVYL